MCVCIFANRHPADKLSFTNTGSMDCDHRSRMAPRDCEDTARMTPPRVAASSDGAETHRGGMHRNFGRDNAEPPAETIPEMAATSVAPPAPVSAFGGTHRVGIGGVDRDIREDERMAQQRLSLVSVVNMARYS